MNAPLEGQQLRTGAMPAEPAPTHQVCNQAAPAAGFNAFDGDAVLSAAIAC